MYKNTTSAGICLFILAISGCATNSGVMALGPDTYQISTGADNFRGGESGAKRMALQNAQSYCAKLGKALLVKNMSTGFSGNLRQVDVTFMCMNKNDPEYTRPTYENTPDIVIEEKK